MSTDSTMELMAQLGVAGAMVLLMTLIHATGLISIHRILHLQQERLERLEFGLRALRLMGSLGLLLFALHIVEIAVFAVFYLVVAGMSSLEEALYYSASAYATLGRTADYFPDQWRLIGAIEALIGFVLIGWSTAFIVATTNRLRR